MPCGHHESLRAVGQLGCLAIAPRLLTPPRRAGGCLARSECEAGDRGGRLVSGLLGSVLNGS
jgi:hypothetical protein